MFSLSEISKYSIVSGGKMIAMQELCKLAPDRGSVIEVGVWRGGIGLLLLNLFPSRTIWLADTFNGIPYSDPQYDSCKAGDFNGAPVEEVKKLFSPYPNVKILQGIFPNAFANILDKETFAVVHLDVDVHKSYKDGLDFLYPRVMRGGLIFLDDYNEGGCKGATIATDEFLIKHNEKIKSYNGQYYFVKE